MFFFFLMAQELPDSGFGAVSSQIDYTYCFENMDKFPQK